LDRKQDDDLVNRIVNERDKRKQETIEMWKYNHRPEVFRLRLMDLGIDEHFDQLNKHYKPLYEKILALLEGQPPYFVFRSMEGER